MESNIRKYYLFTFFRQFNLILSIYMIFYLEAGLSMAQSLGLMAIMGISWAVFDIPTGILSDYIGRKKTLIASAAFSVIALLIYFFSDTFWAFAVASFFFGIGNSLVSGINSSFCYDTLLCLGRHSDYKKTEGTAFAINSIAMGIGALAGGYLASVNIRLPYLLMTLSMTAAGLTAMTFKEPLTMGKNHKKHLTHLRESFIFILSQRRLLIFFLYSSLTFTLAIGCFNLFQPYLQEIGISISRFGVVYVFLLFCTALGARAAHSLELKVGEAYSLIIALAFYSVSLFFLGFIVATLAIFIMFFIEFAFGFLYPVISDHVNRHVPSEKRATVNSIGSMLNLGLSAALLPFLGMIADWKGIAFAYRGEFLASLLLLVVFSGIFIRMRRRKEIL